jgi:hypothetical protein
MCDQFDKKGSVPKDDLANITPTAFRASGCIMTNDSEGDEECNGGEKEG